MSWKGRRVLVTGGGGFIGSHLVKRLLEEDADLHLLIKKTGSLWRLKDRADQCTIWESDITDADALHALLPRINPQVVFHLAALVNVSRSWDLIIPVLTTNLLGTVNLLTGLKGCELEAFIHAGSSEEYGDVPSPIPESQRESPISPYSFSKVASTHFCQMVARTFDLPVTILRLFPTYGPFQEGTMVIPSAIRDLLLMGTFSMSAGEQRREFNYIDDVIEAFLKVAECTDARGEVVNVGNGVPYRVREVVEMIQELVGGNTTLKIGKLPYRRGEGMECYCDNRKLKRLTGWSPCISLKEGLRMTVDWYKLYHSSRRLRKTRDRDSFEKTEPVEE